MLNFLTILIYLIIHIHNTSSWYQSMAIMKILNTFIYKERRTIMFTAALFRMAKTWKQPKYPLMGYKKR